jgi:aspartate racemase
MKSKSKTIGMIGGIAPPSTVDYYQRIIHRYQERTGLADYPPVIINSINMSKMLDLVSHERFDELIDYLLAEIASLEKAGAHIIFMASNTPHIVFGELKNRTRTPMVSIVDSAIKYAKTQGYYRLGLLGTLSTMESGFYQEGFSEANLEIITPMPDERKYINKVYLDELVKGRFYPETKRRLIDISNRMVSEGQVDALILGGTELPFILKADDFDDIPLMNTTKIHVESILDEALK